MTEHPRETALARAFVAPKVSHVGMLLARTSRSISRTASNRHRKQDRYPAPPGILLTIRSWPAPCFRC